MKVKLISVLVVALVAGALADRAIADGALTNHLGYALTHSAVGETVVDMADYLSVYRFDVGSYGVFDVMLFNSRTSATSANFRSYADRDDYDGSFMHRSIDVAGSGIGVVQGGGFTYSDDVGYPEAIPSDPPVINEPGISNTQGTIALAKTGAGPSTGTNQWYFNTADNTSLDNPANNGGYTVFGEVLYDGMDVVGRDGEGTGIAGLPTWNAGSPFDNLPLSEDYDGMTYIQESDFVTLSSVSQVTGQTYAVVDNSNAGLVAAFAAGSSLTLDVTEGVVGTADLTVRVTDGAGQWFDAILKVEVAPSVAIMEINWDMASPTWADGDLNESGVIDNTDLTILASSYYTVPLSAPGDVPEPVTCVLLGIGGIASLARRRR